MMGVSLSDAVFEALSGCLDPAPNTRMTAELQIKHLATSAGRFNFHSFFNFGARLK
jgi:hypothetical protein